MKLSTKELEDFILYYLFKLGFVVEEAKYICENLLDAEMSGRKTHGIMRLMAFKRMLGEGKLVTLNSPLDIISETATSLHIDGHKKLGYSVIYQSLVRGFEKVKQSGMVSIGVKNVNITGYIGGYARKATEKDFIYIGFHNSPGGLVPHGSIKELWGTNPVTVGVPTNTVPVILDMATSYIPFGALINARTEGKQLPSGVAIDREGNPTTDPQQAIDGGLLPIAGHKGSGLAFIVELLAGALTGSRVGYAVDGGWGSFAILIDPTIFRPLADFKNDIDKAIQELKAAPKANGVSEIYFAGEQSFKKRQLCLENNEVEVSDQIFAKLQE